mmetsp:Transcript_22846/g.65369  ORF Transcript_22846/g.65369 Transcript_22846/m.65369 type:complete len:311 (+) Transcript_22846:172-1104(+)
MIGGSREDGNREGSLLCAPAAVVLTLSLSLLCGLRKDTTRLPCCVSLPLTTDLVTPAPLKRKRDVFVGDRGSMSSCRTVSVRPIRFLSPCVSSHFQMGCRRVRKAPSDPRSCMVKLTWSNRGSSRGKDVEVLVLAAVGVLDRRMSSSRHCVVPVPGGISHRHVVVLAGSSDGTNDRRNRAFSALLSILMRFTRMPRTKRSWSLDTLTLAQSNASLPARKSFCAAISRLAPARYLTRSPCRPRPSQECSSASRRSNIPLKSCAMALGTVAASMKRVVAASHDKANLSDCESGTGLFFSAHTRLAANSSLSL